MKTLRKENLDEFTADAQWIQLREFWKVRDGDTVVSDVSDRINYYTSRKSLMSRESFSMRTESVY